MLIGLITNLGLFAQSEDFDIDKLKSSLEDLNDNLSNAIPFAATLGNTWSDSYIGQFPHFGVGLFTGAVLIPVDGFNDVLKSIDSSASIPSEVSVLSGVPFPVLGGEARLGGLFLPFDVGLKFGVLNVSIDKAKINYTMVGTDVRYPLLKGNALIPAVSVGLGYNYLSTDLSIQGLLDGDYTIIDTRGNSSLPPQAQHAYILKDPDFDYGWSSHVFEAKVQASKGLLIFTPYLGLGASYGISTIGGSIATTVVDENGNKVSQDDIDKAAEAAGVSSFNTDGINVDSDLTGFAFKIYGGSSIDMLIIKLDFGAAYNIVSQDIAGQVGLRLQL